MATPFLDGKMASIFSHNTYFKYIYILLYVKFHPSPEVFLYKKGDYSTKTCEMLQSELCQANTQLLLMLCPYYGFPKLIFLLMQFVAKINDANYPARRLMKTKRGANSVKRLRSCLT